MNVRSLYRAGSLKTVASELAKYNLDSVAVQEVRCDEGVIAKVCLMCFPFRMV